MYGEYLMKEGSKMMINMLGNFVLAEIIEQSKT
jgi:hypothetical protein